MIFSNKDKILSGLLHDKNNVSTDVLNNLTVFRDLQEVIAKQICEVF